MEGLGYAIKNYKLTQGDLNMEIFIIYGLRLPNKENFCIVGLPKNRKGHQWHRDIYPALRRFSKKYGTNKPYVCGFDSLAQKQKIIKSDRLGKSNHFWIVYNLNTREFDKSFINDDIWNIK